ncbi:RNA polymerase sigma factor [Thiobacillus denitrificans]|uniref:RNA polymerase sigma factor n=1 Tax=Thiobacillus denitrificans TaxID=36861 RepID=UPI00037A4C2C|nr:RNA polymerase sigma factor [Thiobacillus denitrificans]
MPHTSEPPTIESTQDTAWLAQIALGGEKALMEPLKGLMTRHGPGLYRFFKRHRLSDEESEELVQDVFTKVWQQAHSFEGRASVKTWIQGIARNCMIDLIRKKQVRKTSEHTSLSATEDGEDAELTLDIPDPDADGRLHDWYICMKQGLERFHKKYPEHHHALELRSMGLEYEEIADQTGRNSPGAAREFLRVCRERLEAFIGECRSLATV